MCSSLIVPTILLRTYYSVIMQTEIRIDASGAYYEVGQGAGPSGSSSNSTQKLQTAEISLNDCLACR